MANKNYYMQQPIGVAGVAPTYNPSRVHTSPHGAFTNAPEGLNVGQYFNNNTIGSKYTESLGDVNAAIKEGRTVEDLLAEKQSGWEMAGNALLNNAVIAGTTLISGTLGIADGLFEALVNGDSSKIWDNSVNNWAVDTQESMKEAFPIYRGEEYNNSSIWDKMGTGIFWADLVENLGFTEGMLVPGMAASRALQGLGKGAQMLGGSFISSIGEGSIEAINARNDEVRNKTALLDQRYNELSQTVDSSELPELYNEYQKAINDIEEDANNAGNFTFGANVALLTLTNSIEFGNLFSRGFSTGRKITGQLTREGEKYIADSGKKAIAKATGKKLIDAFSEGMEEVSQKAISGTSQYYTDYNKFNESIFNPEKRELVGSLISAFGESYANTLQDPQTAEEFASGFIIGLTGVPQLRRAKIPVKIENNIAGNIYEAYKKNKREQELANNINSRLANDKQFNAYYDGIVRHLAIQDDINTAIDEADHTAFENATSAQLISDIMMFSDAGHLGHLKELINGSVDLSDEGVNDIIEETSKDGNGPFMSNGNKMSVEDVRELIKRKQDYINHKIDFISKSKEELESAFPNLNETGLANALFLKSQIEDHQTRFDALKDEAHAGIVKLFSSYINNETTEKGSKKNPRKGTIYVKTKDGKKTYVKPSDIDYFDADGTVVLKESESSKPEINPYKKLIPTEEELLLNLNNPSFGELVQNLLNSDNSTMSKDERLKLSETLRDLGKLQVGLIELNKGLSTTILNPEKANNSKQAAFNKVEKVNEAKGSIKVKDQINNSEVSDIVKGIEDEDLNVEELDGLFSAEDNEFLNSPEVEEQLQPSGKQKVEEAKKIIETSQRMDRAIDSLDDGSIDPQAIADAHTLLQYSKEVSNSEEELLNTRTQAFNDPNNLAIELGEAVQEANQAELEANLNERIDGAKNVIERAKAILAEQNEELRNLPENAPVIRNVPSGDTQNNETGHDTTAHIVTENERQKVKDEQRVTQEAVAEEQAKVNELFKDLKADMSSEDRGTFNKALSEVLHYINNMIDAKATNQEIGKSIKDTQSYQIAKQLAPNLDDYLDVYVTSRLNPKVEEIAKQTEEPKVTTPVITDQQVRQQTTEQANVSPNQEETGTYQYWKPTISYLPFGKAHGKGDNTPFYKMARTLTNSDGTSMFTEQQLRRIEAVGKYLDEHGAFKLVDSGVVQGEINKQAFDRGAVGDTVGFAIDSTLNEEAGELVILITDNQGRVLGDIMSPNDLPFNEQIGLKSFVERITKEYNDAGSPQYFTSKETTTVDKNMVGQVPYLADHEPMNSINAIFSDGDNLIPFKLSIAMTSGGNPRMYASAGRTKGQGQSRLEQSINPPVVARVGQPFLLLETSDKSGRTQYMPVPFIMDAYGLDTQGTALGKAIHEVLGRVPTSDNNEAVSIIDALKELISVKEVHINYDGDNVKVTIKPNNVEHQITIYNGPKNADNIVEQLELGLQGQPFQVSRKYINDTYGEQDYNRMIGEVAKVNLPIGTTHTVSDWFTLKPLDASGKPMKSKSVRSTGRNPYAAKPSEIIVQKNGMQFSINPNTWEVSDGIKTYEGSDADKVKAQAFGIYTNQNMEKPYDTEWGYYDPKTDEFVEKPTKVIRTIGTSQDTQAAQVATQNSVDTQVIDVPKIGGGTRKETVQQVETSQLKVGDLIWYSGPESSTPINQGTVEQITEDGYVVLDNSLIKDRTYYKVISETQDENPAQLEDKAKKAGLLGNKVRQALWKTLSTEQQAIIVNKKGPRQKQWMDELEIAFDPTTNTFDEAKLKGTVDEHLGKAMYRKTDGSENIWNRDKELGWIQKALPQLSNEEHLRIVDGLIKISKSAKPDFAWGMFKNGMITISDQAASGTAYHEAFHAVVHTLLSDDEYNTLFNEARKKWKNLEDVAVEENLAEDFRRYVQLEETPILGNLIKIYRKLKHWIQNLSGKEPYITRLYYDISRGNMANRAAHAADIIRYNSNLNNEMQAIKEQAIADGTFMKAPNGKPTNLTEGQWLQVRTKNFINWFGDWINDPANASKVVDENGEPLVVYHGSKDNTFTIFDRSKNDKGQKGFFFTNSEVMASSYGKNPRGFFLNSRDPYTIEGNGSNWNAIYITTSSIAKNKLDAIRLYRNQLQLALQKGTTNKETYDFWDREYFQYLDKYNSLGNSTTDKIKKYILQRRLNAFQGEGDFIKSTRYAENILEYDTDDVSIIFKNITDYGPVFNIDVAKATVGKMSGNVYVVTNPNQIKSATDNIGTFDSNNPDIRYRMAEGFTGTVAEFQAIVDSMVDRGMKTRVSKNKEWGRLVDIWKSEGYEVKGYWNKETKKWTVTSVKSQEQQYLEIKQHHRDKLMYENLSQEDKDYIKDKGISIEEYTNMTTTEKEVLLHCKY